MIYLIYLSEVGECYLHRTISLPTANALDREIVTTR